jgi:hypothetical protein
MMARALEEVQAEGVFEASLAASAGAPRVLAREPPEIERLFLKPLPSGGKALLLAHMAKGETLPDKIELDLGSGASRCATTARGATSGRATGASMSAVRHFWAAYTAPSSSRVLCALPTNSAPLSLMAFRIAVQSPPASMRT